MTEVPSKIDLDDLVEQLSPCIIDFAIPRN